MSVEGGLPKQAGVKREALRTEGQPEEAPLRYAPFKHRYRVRNKLRTRLYFNP